MTTTGLDERAQEIRDIHTRYKFVYQIIGGLTLVLLGVLIGTQLFRDDRGYGTNLYTEVLSIAVTVFILDRLAQRREEKREQGREQEKAQQAREEEKRRLIRQMRSSVSQVAMRATEELRDFGWHNDGSLNQEDLSNVKLERVDLRFSSLLGTDLSDANLLEAKLGNAYLIGAILANANLTRSELRRANLEWALLTNTNFQDAELRQSKLQRANLIGANLQGADVRDIECNEMTILPDGSIWIPNTDLRRFTDPAHPHFWRSDDPNSPAYRGKGEG